MQASSQLPNSSENRLKLFTDDGIKNNIGCWQKPSFLNDDLEFVFTLAFRRSQPTPQLLRDGTSPYKQLATLALVLGTNERDRPFIIVAKAKAMPAAIVYKADD